MLSAAVVRVLAISGYNNIAPIKWNFIRPPLGGHPGWSIASHARTCLALPGVRFHLSPNACKTLHTVSLVYESVFTCKRDVQNQVEAKLSCQQRCFVYSTDLWLHVFKNYIFLIENYLREKKHGCRKWISAQRLCKIVSARWRSLRCIPNLHASFWSAVS